MIQNQTPLSLMKVAAHGIDLAMSTSLLSPIGKRAVPSSIPPGITASTSFTVTFTESKIEYNQDPGGHLFYTITQT
jgi:hypothetical protein